MAKVLSCSWCRKPISRRLDEVPSRPIEVYDIRYGYAVPLEALVGVQQEQGKKSYARGEEEPEREFSGTFLACPEGHALGVVAPDPDGRTALLDEDMVYFHAPPDQFRCRECDGLLTGWVALVDREAVGKTYPGQSVVDQGQYIVGLAEGERELVLSIDSAPDLEVDDNASGCCGPIGDVLCKERHKVGEIFLDHWAPNWVKLDPQLVRAETYP